jgi:hypothetical protein
MGHQSASVWSSGEPPVAVHPDHPATSIGTDQGMQLEAGGVALGGSQAMNAGSAFFSARTCEQRRQS